MINVKFNQDIILLSKDGGQKECFEKDEVCKFDDLLADFFIKEGVAIEIKKKYDDAETYSPEEDGYDREPKFNKEEHLDAIIEQTKVKLQKYKCCKKVHALKIKNIEIIDNFNAIIIPEEDGYAPFEISPEYMKKHQPQVGGYYVVYEDGYQSYSPAKAFEEGYTLVINN